MTALFTRRRLQDSERAVTEDALSSRARLSEFSCAAPDRPLLKRLIIRSIETMTGQPYLKRLYEDFRRNRVPGESFWSAVVNVLDLKIEYNRDALLGLPKTGPLVIVANHPFGVLDGLIVSYLTSKVRDDFLFLTSSNALHEADEIRAHLLLIDFSETKQALETNLNSRAAAKTHLLQGGVLVVFPAGGQSTTPNLWSTRAVDAQWRNFTGRLIVSTKAPVLPIFIAGQNSQLFQIASHISWSLRLSLFFKEIRDKMGCVLRVQIGQVIPYDELERLDRAKVMEHLRRKTYELGASIPQQIRGRRPARRPVKRSNRVV